MIDIFALGLSHVLLAMAAWRLLFRDDLDQDGIGPERGAARAARRAPQAQQTAAAAAQEPATHD